MNTDSLPIGPDRDSLIALIRQTWPETVVATLPDAAFFSLDESNWPNYATVVWSDAFDEGAPSDLSARPEVYRLNIGVGKESFERLVGGMTDPDHAAFDRFVPHPVYGRQRWISIVNPSHETVRDAVMPLLSEAHDRLAAQRERQKPIRP
ncbi:MAG TPA: DUF6194 family protein [Candidatus Limnocylindria bacterium]|nr:DUF6194 family protein [Candidatus Limnocylindria bacterium]